MFPTTFTLLLSSVGVVSSLAVGYAVSYILYVERLRRRVGRHPDLYKTFGSGPLWDILPTFMGRFGITHDVLWKGKQALYEKAGIDAILIVSYFPPRVKFHIADPIAIKKVVTERSLFRKPTYLYRMMDTFGQNLVIVEDGEWIRHRKLANPAFGEKNNVYVWEQTARIMEEMFEDWDSHARDHREARTVDSTRELGSLLEVALLVIISAAFGQKAHWNDESEAPAGHQMTFRQAVAVAAEDIVYRIAIPGPFWGSKSMRDQVKLTEGLAGRGWLGRKVQKAATGLTELQAYMEEMINDQRSSKLDNRKDIFSQLLRDLGSDDSGLTEKEAIGNTFIFLLAGHETTAHSLAFLFGLLALEEEKQKELYDYIKAALGDRKPSYGDYSSLDLVLGAFYEALRLHPTVKGIPKHNVEDTVLTISENIAVGSGSEDIILPKGCEIWLDPAGVHYNSRYWKDPYEFKPERFLDPNWPREAFIPFSLGHRACIGRRFSEIEAVVVTTLLVLRYEIRIDTALFREIPGETKLQRRDRLLSFRHRITSMPLGVPLVFVRR